MERKNDSSEANDNDCVQSLASLSLSDYDDTFEFDPEADPFVPYRSNPYYSSIGGSPWDLYSINDDFNLMPQIPGAAQKVVSASKGVQGFGVGYHADYSTTPVRTAEHPSPTIFPSDSNHSSDAPSSTVLASLLLKARTPSPEPPYSNAREARDVFDVGDSHFDVEVPDGGKTRHESFELFGSGEDSGSCLIWDQDAPRDRFGDLDLDSSSDRNSLINRASKNPSISQRHEASGGRQSSSRNTPKPARRDRERDRLSINTEPAPFFPDEAVLKPPAQAKTSLVYPFKAWGNASLKSFAASSKNTASRNSANKSPGSQTIGHIDDETTASALASAIARAKAQKDTALAIGGRSSSAMGIEPPESQEHSDDAHSTCLTDASTPESGSFWLAEYSEDEDRKLEDDHPFSQFKELAVFRVLVAFHTWKGNPSKEDIPCDGAGESNPASTRDKGKGKSSATGKRTWADQSEANENIDDGSGPSSNRVDCSKRRRTSHRQLTFACPYTKKDPMLYRDCYRYKLSRIRDVKQHLARCHRKPLYCPRCMGTFGTEVERDDHIREFSCPSRRSITLDGITEYQKSQLAKKSAPNASPEAQWFAVFEIVFPGHKPKPASPYVDSELLQDITLYQDFLTSNGPRILSGILDERGAVTWNLPDGERDLAAFQQTVFEEGLRTVFDQWFARRSSNSPDLTMSSSSGSNSRDTPPSSSASRERVGSTSGHGSGNVPHEGMGTLPSGRPVDTLPDSEDIVGSSIGPGSFDEGLDATFRLEYGDFDFPAELNIDELVGLFGDDAQVSSEPGRDQE